MKKIISLFLISVMLVSCGSDDDICTSGEATPRMKIKFKNAATGNIKKLDSLYLDVDYGSGLVNIVQQKLVDSVLIPLRVDEASSTDIFVRLTKAGAKSKIKVNYSAKTEYVSPACGIKKLYENLGTELVTPTPVLSVEKNQTSILDENKTHLYLHF